MRKAKALKMGSFYFNVVAAGILIFLAIFGEKIALMIL